MALVGDFASSPVSLWTREEGKGDMCREHEPLILSLNILIKCVLFLYNISINMHNRYVRDNMPIFVYAFLTYKHMHTHAHTK